MSLGSPARSNRRKRVLIVEDDQDARDVLGEMIGALGHDTFKASTAHEAIERAECTPLDLVLIDLSLPGIDGFEVARRIRGIVSNAGARLVALTGYSDAESRRSATLAGFDDFLVKPAYGSALEALVNARPLSAD
jgi:CheY-like chemotaxis protein